MSLSKIALQPLQNEFQGNVVRGVGGFAAKYFEASAVDTKVKTSAALVNTLSRTVLDLTDIDALTAWLVALQPVFQAGDLQATRPGFVRFRSAPLNAPGSPLRASIDLASTDPQTPKADRLRVFGEFSPSARAAPVGDDDDDDAGFLPFCGRARQLFAAQPTRRFLHGFRVCGTVLALWVFDRAGAYSSEPGDLAQQPDLLVRTLVGYALLSDEACGLDTFVAPDGPARCCSVAFAQHNGKLYLRPDVLAAPDYLVGLGTTCYAAAHSAAGTPDSVVKFSWRTDEDENAEPRLLTLARERQVRGIVRLLGVQDLVSIVDLRRGLQFPRPFANRTLSCIATTPLGRPLQHFSSVRELLGALRDLVKALQSLYVDGRILHRDICIRNLIIAPLQNACGSAAAKGVLIDFDLALDLDHASESERQPLVGSDGFMAIGILQGQRHTYRHDLESLFYVFLWFAIGNDRVNDDACAIIEHLPVSSRLRNWCSMSFRAVGLDKADAMSPDGFRGLLAEFSEEFVPLRGLATVLHELLFPVRCGSIFTGTDTEPVAIQRLYDEMADAFEQSAHAFDK